MGGFRFQLRLRGVPGVLRPDPSFRERFAFSDARCVRCFWDRVGVCKYLSFALGVSVGGGFKADSSPLSHRQLSLSPSLNSEWLPTANLHVNLLISKYKNGTNRP